MRCLGCTSMDKFRKFIEKDPGLERRFQQVGAGADIRHCFALQCSAVQCSAVRRGVPRRSAVQRSALLDLQMYVCTPQPLNPTPYALNPNICLQTFVPGRMH